MDYRRAVTAVLVVALLVGATPAFAAIASYSAPVQGEVPVTTDQTPTIYLASSDQVDVDLVDMWAGDQLNITTAQGNITVSGGTNASARIYVDDIEGTKTRVTEINASNGWLNLNPDDKSHVDVRGDVETLSFTDITANNGQTDLTVTGPDGGSVDLRLYGLEANREMLLYNASADRAVQYFNTDSSGQATTTFTLDGGTQDLQVRTVDSFSDPSLTNATPEGQVTERPTQLAVDVEADLWPAEVEFRFENETVKTVNATENGTVTADVTVDTLGSYNWSATVTDDAGRTDTLNASFETPDELTIREENQPRELINNTTVTLRFYTVDGEIAIERETSNASIDMEGLPDSEFVVFVESPNHYDRTVYIESIFEQEQIFLLNSTAYPQAEDEAVRSEFIYEDLTGEFPTAETTIQIQRQIDLNGDNTSEWRTVAGDYWGASNDYSVILEEEKRYRVVLVNQETGDRYVAGTHIPTDGRLQSIRVSGLVIEARNASGIFAYAELNESGTRIDIIYDDPEEKTDSLQVVVESRGGDEVLFEETVDGPIGTYSTTVDLNESQAEKDWVVRFNAGDRHQSALPVGSGSITLPLSVPGWLMTFLMSMAVTFVGALYGPRTAVLGAWSMVFVAAGVAMFGWAFSGPSVIVAALVATGTTLLSRFRP